MKTKNKIYLVIFILIQSCNQKDLRVENRNVKKSEMKSDSVFYDLPPQTITFIEDTLLKGIEVNHCTLNINSSYNEFSFSFQHYTNYKIPIEVQNHVNKTNRFLRLKHKKLPLLFDTDFIFNKELNKSQKNIRREFDFSFVKTNAEGEIKDAFSYKWDFSGKSK